LESDIVFVFLALGFAIAFASGIFLMVSCVYSFLQSRRSTQIIRR
jgi:hypothetical protein